jgi:hypothetical protein
MFLSYVRAGLSHLTLPSPVLGGGAPSYGAEGEGGTKDHAGHDPMIRNARWRLVSGPSAADDRGTSPETGEEK